jgi:hypothetical protein
VVSPHPPAASQAASSSPSLQTLKAAMTAVPSGMLMTKKSAGKKGKKRATSLAKDGQIVSKFFNPIAGRPQPALTSLEQGITVTLSLTGFGFTSSATVPAYGGNTFSLSQCPSAAQYTSLFDQYKFEQIEVWLEPLNESTAAVTTGMASAIDLDDANTPSAYGDVSDRQGSLQGNTLSGRYHKWKPHMAVAVYSGAFTSFANEVAGWIDVASPAVQHYGLKIATNGADGVSRGFLFNVRAVVSFRGPAI